MNTSKQPRILHLNLHREFFRDVVNGEKPYEYRDFTPYWTARLEDRTYDIVQFRNGYASDAPEAIVEFLGVRRTTKRGAKVYAIRLGRLLKVRRWKD